MGFAFMLILLGTALAAGDIPLVIEPDAPLLRPGVPLAVTLRGPVERGGALRLALHLEQDGRILADARAVLANARHLADGVTLHLVAEARGEQALVLRAFVEGEAGRGETQLPLETLEQRLLAFDRAISQAKHTALAQLRGEQGLLLLRGHPTLHDLARVETLARELQQSAPPDGTWALRCRIDGSVQPLRIHRPPGAVQGVVLVARTLAQTPSKVAWPELPAAWRRRAQEAGLALIEWYPAGDRDWQGIAASRLLQQEAVLAEQGWHELPVLGLGQGSAAAALLQLARRQPRPQALLLDQVETSELATAELPTDLALARCGPRRRGGEDIPWLAVELDDPAPWHWLLGQARQARTRQAPSPAAASPSLDDYASGPFAVVIGSGDNAATAERHRRLAQAFLDDWAAHAQGAPTWLWDHQEDHLPEDHHLVLIGGPISNRISARLLDEQLPLRWDHRQLQADERRLLRSEPFGLGLRREHPEFPGRVLIVLDGDPFWTRGGQKPPLHGLPPLVLHSEDEAR